MNSSKNLNKMIKIALLATISVILMFIEIPMTPFPWLKIDLSEVPALMGGFAFGPLAAVVIIVLKNLLYVLLRGTSSGFVGQLANIIIGITLVLPAAIMYRKNKTKKTAIIGMIIGFFTIQLGGIIANKYLLIPLYGGEAAVLGGNTFVYYILFGLLPINGLKSILVSVVTYVLYKKLSVSLFKVEPMKSENKKIA
ncbi:MAG: ECF transporter S component [Clostridium celatum]|uniref:ECF transporter S component n=1 Tax=uncultured Clostridium sp. TaxID=59620 RepID=UPI0025D45132|nr:ECF transporter S component [uncultured Clostridium sp.]MDU4882782.1 ECF transporter S component [Clostridium celatum]MDU5263192.1 ECF transporter S component [Clostridium celatum]MDU7075948.1 ECF transporter S component [Clostridium celatum]